MAPANFEFTSRTNNDRPSRWRRLLSGISTRKLAGSLGLGLLAYFTLTRGASNPNDVRTRHHSTSTIKAKSATFDTEDNDDNRLPPWTRGTLDIHHLQVGSSVSTFVVMPDGTTALIDAGDVNVPYTLQQWSKEGPPFNSLNLKAPFPNDSRTPVGWIIEYLKDFWPFPGADINLDYLLITHFHSDHFGDGHTERGNERTKRAKSKSGKYILSGVSELASKVGVKKIIDRGFPDYNEPIDLRSLKDKSMDNYLAFVEENKDTIPFEHFDLGSSKQITMKNGDGIDFRMRTVKCGSQVAAPHEGHDHMQIPGTHFLKDHVHASENTMSAAFVIEYGPFRYYEGGDQDIIRDKDGNVVFDTIEPTSRIVGVVDVASLNHHGHGVSKDFVDYIDPHVMVLQGWSSDQPPAKSVELLANARQDVQGLPRKIFATDIFHERLDALGPKLSEMFGSTSGHVVVRVYPHGKGGSLRERLQTFEVFILDEKHRVKAKHGHFPVRINQ